MEFGPPVDTIRSRSRDALNNAPETLSPKPMTPRRIKRRSVMNRGTTSRTSTQSRRSHHSRSSHRSSRRKVHQSPVTKLLEQQQQNGGKNLPSFSRGPIASTSSSHLTESNLKSLNNDYGPIPSTSTARTASDIVRHSPDPIYYNMTHNVSSPLQQETTSWSPSPPPGHYPPVSNQGHSNPTYQHSTPNLSHSPEPMDEPYGNRPPSVRSSYSNFHGARPLSSYNPNTGAKENVFLGLTQPQAQSQPQQPPPPVIPNPKPPQNEVNSHSVPATHKHEPFRPKPAAAPPPTHPKPYAHVQPQAQMPPSQSPSPYQHLPQLPQKTRMAMANSRESMNSIAFINSGPPAYNLNYHTPPDSETTM